MKYYIENNEDGMVANIGYLYDSILIDKEVYLNDAGRFISTVFTRVIKVGNAVDLKWLKELIQKQPKILKQDNSDTNTFKEEIKYVEVKNYSDEAQSLIYEIADLLEVTIQGESE